MRWVWALALLCAQSTAAPALLHAAAAGRAQDTAAAPPRPAYRLEPLLVGVTRGERSAERAPRALQVLGQAAIQRGEATLSLDEVLRAVPGVGVDNRYNFSLGDRISIRGTGARAQFGVRGVRLIVDGVPATMPDGQSQLSNLDLGAAGRLEVLRGPSSSLYGNAAGGVITLESEDAPPYESKLEPKLIAGSYGLRKLQAKALGHAGPLGYVVNLSRTSVEGFREHAAAEMVALNLIGRASLFRDARLTTTFNFFDSPFAMNPSSLDRATADTAPRTSRAFVQAQGAGERGRHGQFGIGLQRGALDDPSLDATAYGLWRSVLNPIPGRIIDLEREAGGLRAAYRGRLAGARVRWLVGADLELQSDTRIEHENRGLPDTLIGRIEPSEIPAAIRFGCRGLEQRERVIGVGPFAEVGVELGSGWALTLGGRYDSYHFRVQDRLQPGSRAEQCNARDPDDSGTRSMDQVSPLFGIAFRPVPYLTIYGNWATAFQTPTTSELGNRPDGAGGFNPGLEPERIRIAELGMKGVWPAARLSYEAAAYLGSVRDALIPFQLSTDEVFHRNAGRTRQAGVELGIGWQPLPRISTTLAFTFLDLEFRDFLKETSAGDTVQLRGRKVPGLPRRRLFAGVEYQHPAGVYGELNFRWVDDTFANDFNGPPPGSSKPLRDFLNDAYGVVDLRLGFEGQRRRIGISPFLGLNNVFDARYSGSLVPNASGNRFFEPAPGRNAYVGLTIPLRRMAAGSDAPPD
ncbi:MAG: TonB-dependent receptor [Gemmatimonadetes bacterium]|nr:TonB-dependent receptor [Gemmatimonadota bacterium]